jgi:hypothetical protein
MAGVQGIINEASLFENPDEVKEQQKFRNECSKEASKCAAGDL